MQAVVCVGVELEVVGCGSGVVIVSEGRDELDVGEASEVDPALFGIGNELGL